MKRKQNLINVKSSLQEKTTTLKDDVFTFSGPLTIADVCNKTSLDAFDIIKYFFKQGIMINLNQNLNMDQIAEICLENGLDFKKQKDISDDDFIDDLLIKDEDSELKPKPPIITVMGHVDHGKTTLIDYIRKTNVAGSETGGITQHTGAYQIEHNGGKITIIDTPGHETFTQMRLRGSQLTDIVILVIAADDGVMPQTKEAINHAIQSKAPVIIFVNKIDKVDKVNKEKIYNDISAAGLTPEEWGGDTIFVYGSALKGTGIDDLFKAILLQSEMLELKANPTRLPSGIVVESRIDKGQGAIATLIIQNGTMEKRDFIVAGSHYGRVRQLLDTNKKPIKSASPGTPVIITGLNYSPQPGEKFIGFDDEKFAKQLAAKRKIYIDQKKLKDKHSWRNTLTNKKILNVIIKTNVNGTSEAIKGSLLKIQNDEVKINVVLANAGAINKSDILLAQASKALIYGFNVRPTAAIRSLAKDSEIDIRTHSIIYKLIEEIEDIVKGMLAPKYKEQIFGTSTILKVIFSSAFGNIAGVKVESGEMLEHAKVRLIRNGVVVYDGIIKSLRRGEKNVRKVPSGLECGILIKNYNNIKVDDIIETYGDVEIKVEK